MSAVRVLLVDDHALVRAGIRVLLDKVPGVEVIGEADNGRAALELAKTMGPHVILLDISMAELGGLETLPRIVRDFPAIKVVILSAHSNEEFVLRALRSGAAGYMLKDAAAEELGMAIKAVTEGNTYLSPSVSRTVVESYLERSTANAGVPDPLTARQREILKLIAEGKNTKEVAHILDISAKTVEAHRAQLMERLGIFEVAGLVRYAIRSGLVSAER